MPNLKLEFWPHAPRRRPVTERREARSPSGEVRRSPPRTMAHRLLLDQLQEPVFQRTVEDECRADRCPFAEAAAEDFNLFARL